MRLPESRKRALGALAACAGLALACGGGPPAITECVATDKLVPLCRFQNPEDLAVVGDWLLVSQMRAGDKPGSLVAFRPSDGQLRTLFPLEGAEGAQGPCTDGAGPPFAREFAPHGMDLAGTTLLVVNHGREAVEEFTLGAADGAPTLAWRQCVALPNDASSNDVAALNTGGFVVTKMYERPQLLGMLKVALDLNSGELLRFTPPSTRWRTVPNTAGRSPNGVEEGPDGTLYIAEWSARRLVRVASDGSRRSEVPLDFSPDNLSWASDGRLLVAGQRTSLLGVLRCASLDNGTCPLASVVAAVDPGTLAVTKLVEDDPATTLGAASVAVELDDALWIGSFAGDRLVKRPGTH